MYKAFHSKTEATTAYLCWIPQRRESVHVSVCVLILLAQADQNLNYILGLLPFSFYVY